MMNTSGGSSPDPINGWIALLDDPKAASAKLKEMKTASDALAKAQADLVKASEEQQKRAKELVAESAALDDRERAIAASEMVAAKKLDAAKEAEASIAERELKLQADIAAWEKAVADAKEEAKATKAEIRKDRTALTKETKAADEMKAEAEAALKGAQETVQEAESLKAEYQAKLDQLAQIVKAG